MVREHVDTLNQQGGFQQVKLVILGGLKGEGSSPHRIDFYQGSSHI
jgi:hypothetical protein